MPCRSDSVRTSFGLLLVYLDYLSALPCWILFADRRPTLALGLLSALSVAYLFADVFDPVCFVTMSINKSLQMDPHASRRLRKINNICPLNPLSAAFNEKGHLGTAFQQNRYLKKHFSIFEPLEYIQYLTKKREGRSSIYQFCGPCQKF